MATPAIISGPHDRILRAGASIIVGAAGVITVAPPAAPTSVGTTPGTAGSGMAVTGAAGGATSIVTTGTAGQGGGFTYTSGAGGLAASAATASTGGAGGDVAWVTGNGGAANNAANVGTNVGGRSGTFTVTTGTGGAAANGTDTGGASGAISLITGTGGSGDTGGASGAITIRTGAVGAGGSPTAGSILLQTNGANTRLTVADALITSSVAVTISAGGADITQSSSTASPTLNLRNTAGSGATVGTIHTGNAAQYNWLVASNVVINDAFAFVPSTVAGGSSFTTAALTINRTGAVTFTGAVSGITTLATTGVHTFMSGTATTAGGVVAAAFGSSAVVGIAFGSGAPTVSAPKGTLYLRTDGTGVADRAYINSNGSTTWVAISTAG